ncbi:MAG: hypothetical protein SGBAC_003158 [Bacillariaceae sp.]
MVQISKQPRPDIRVLKTPENLTSVQGCCANNGWNRCLLILVTFLFGIAITYLDAFPDLKARKASNLKGGSSGVKREENPDKAMILSRGQIKPNIQASKDSNKKNNNGTKKDVSKVHNKEEKSIYDDNWDPNHNCAYECKTDRLANEVPLYAGEALCNRQYRFGMSVDGDFLVHNCETNVKQVFYSFKNDKKKAKQVPKIYFKLKEDGKFRVVTKDDGKNEKTILFEHLPKRKVSAQKQCLDKPALPCPYLHLRETGLVVLNWIDQETNESMDRYIDRIYPKLYPKD